MNKTLNLLGTEIKYGSMFDQPEFENHFIESAGVGQTELPVFKEVTKHKNILFDVGSSFGWFSYAFCGDNKTKRAFAFDAGVRAHLSTQQVIMLNDMYNITAIRSLIGQHDGFMMAHQDKLQVLMSQHGQSQELIMSVDSLCSILDTVPDVLKIDVEGHEHHVLLGANTLIQEYRPLLFVEIHPKYLPHHGKSIYDILNFFNSIGYIAYDLNKQRIENYKEVLERDLQAEDVYTNRFVWVCPNSIDFEHMESYKKVPQKQRVNKKRQSNKKLLENYCPI